VDRSAANVSFLLFTHLSHRLNLHVVPDLVAFCDALPPKQGAGALRLLRLTVPCLFRPSLYKSRERIARGASSTVYRCQMPDVGGPRTAVLKVTDLPPLSSDHNTIVDAFHEVAVLEELAGCPWACGIHDYGTDGLHLCLVLHDYPFSLREWRAALPPVAGAGAPGMALFLEVFLEVARAVLRLRERGVVHYDLKCDNVLVLPRGGEFGGGDAGAAPGGASAAGGGAGGSGRATEGGGEGGGGLPFQVVLADFGESRLYRDGEPPRTTRNRGTEFVKSPEMLTVAAASGWAREGVGPETDVWSLGCLLYELVTGDLLFYDADWIRFFIRLTQENQPLFSDASLDRMGPYPGLRDLLSYVLVRDPRRRPSLGEVVARAEATRAALLAPARPPASAEPSHRAQTSDRTASTEAGEAAAAEVAPPDRACASARAAGAAAADRERVHAALAECLRVGLARRGAGAAGGPGAGPKTRPLTAEDVSSLLPRPAWRVGPPSAIAPGFLLGPLESLPSVLQGLPDPGAGPPAGGATRVVLLAPPGVAFGSPLHGLLSAAALQCATAGVPCVRVEVPGTAELPPLWQGRREQVSVALLPMLNAVNLVLRHVSAARGPFPRHPPARPGPGAARPPRDSVVVLWADRAEGDAAAAAVGCLVLSGLSLYQATLAVQRRCLSSALTPEHVQMLGLWEGQVRERAARWRAEGRPVCFCACGASKAALLAPEGRAPAPRGAPGPAGRDGAWLAATDQTVDIDPMSPLAVGGRPGGERGGEGEEGAGRDARPGDWTTYRCAHCGTAVLSVGPRGGAEAGGGELAPRPEPAAPGGARLRGQPLAAHSPAGLSSRGWLERGLGDRVEALQADPEGPEGPPGPAARAAGERGGAAFVPGSSVFGSQLSSASRSRSDLEGAVESLSRRGGGPMAPRAVLLRADSATGGG